ncbi:PmoA family protein [Paenibacillus humicola]|uniref:DUF6807 domain-containing protein n=1 Tax=Paenibacillus humicola TaxID=3110540 RepID=UPI00237BF5BB|nr:PmoA family protein [Paenibacillus humicola]
MNHYRFQLSGADLALQPTVLEIPLTENEYSGLLQLQGTGGTLAAAGEGTGAVLACQLSAADLHGTPRDGLARKYSLFVFLQDVPVSGDEHAFIVGRHEAFDAADPKAGVEMVHQPENARVLIRIGGKLFTRYLYSKDLMKPYFYPMIGPREKTLVQDGPDDHLHHHGMWWGHDQVNGHPVYHEFADEGRQVHSRFLHLKGGPVFGQLSVCIDWLTSRGERLLQEVRTMRIFNLPPEQRYVDVHSELIAPESAVEFGPTKEGGFPFIRVNEQLSAFFTGTITASSGKRGEGAIFGTEADWVDYSGKIVDVSWPDGKPHRQLIDAGIAMMVHPDFRAFSTKWFVRDSGAFTPSNFHFWGGHTLPAGERLGFRQRIYLHLGDVTESRVKERYQEYANPVKVRWNES